MNDEAAAENYHGFTIKGQREYPTRGDYERWFFWVSRNDKRQFMLSIKISRTQAVIVGGDDARISRLLKDTGLRQIHGKIDLGQFQEGEQTEYLIGSSSGEITTPSDEEIQLLILQVLEKVMRLYPVRQKLGYFDTEGFCEILGIDHAEYLANAALLRDEGYVADSILQQNTIEKGGLYITPQGTRHLAQLQAQAVPANTSIRIHIDDIDSFAAVQRVTPTDVTDLLTQDGFLDYSEDHVQIALEQILHEPLHKRDWGGEINDLYTANLVLQGRRTPTAFLLKGNGLRRREMRIADCGANGDQIVRLFESPAELFVVQFVGNIAENVIRDVAGKVQQKRNQGVNARYCIINGQDTARLLLAYDKLEL